MWPNSVALRLADRTSRDKITDPARFATVTYTVGRRVIIVLHLFSQVLERFQETVCLDHPTPRPQLPLRYEACTSRSEALNCPCHCQR